MVILLYLILKLLYGLLLAIHIKTQSSKLNTVEPVMEIPSDYSLGKSTSKTTFQKVKEER